MDIAGLWNQDQVMVDLKFEDPKKLKDRSDKRSDFDETHSFGKIFILEKYLISKSVLEVFLKGY